MSFFTINNKQYKSVPFDFGTICDLEELGVDTSGIKKVSLNMVRAYVALCIGCNKFQAGQEINQHIINGGTLEDLSKVIEEEVKASDFFRKMQENAEKSNTEDTK